MGRPQRFRGVRQRHWGSWVSEIRHPLLKTRVWLGTFETAEDAAHAYDEAARLMSGARARTNFPFDPHAPKRPGSQLLSATLTAKLHRWHLQSQQQVAEGAKPGAKKAAAQPLPCLCLHNQARSKLVNLWPSDPPSEPQPSTVSTVSSTTSTHCDPQPNWFPEEDKFAAEMIEELLSWRSPGPVAFISPSTSDSSCSSPFSATTSSAASSAFVM